MRLIKQLALGILSMWPWGKDKPDFRIDGANSEIISPESPFELLKFKMLSVPRVPSFSPIDSLTYIAMLRDKPSFWSFLFVHSWKLPLRRPVTSVRKSRQDDRNLQVAQKLCKRSLQLKAADLYGLPSGNQTWRAGKSSVRFPMVSYIASHVWLPEGND